MLRKLGVALLLVGLPLSGPAQTTFQGKEKDPFRAAAGPGLPFGQMVFVNPDANTLPDFRFLPSPWELKLAFQKQGLTGTVKVRFTVSKRGKTEQFEQVGEGNPEMAKLAAAYIRRMVFKPARKDRKPVAVVAEIEFSNP